MGHGNVLFGLNLGNIASEYCRITLERRVSIVDYRTLLTRERCWDREAQSLLESSGEGKIDAILQNREELIGLCEFIETHRIRSYLEIGIWTGRLVSALHRIFDFDRVAAADHGWAQDCGLAISLPEDADFFFGNSDSDEFMEWRRSLGKFDLVLIDANHRYHAVRKDFEINRQFPHRFLAFHDITGCNPGTEGVARLWNELKQDASREDHGCWEIVRPHKELGLAHSVMGIGVWAEER